MLSTPPFVSKVPVLGSTLEYLKGPVPLMKKGFEMHGNIFSIRLLHKNIAVLVGPQYHRFFFHETDKMLFMSSVFKWLIPIFGDKFPLSANKEEYQQHLSIYTKPFSNINLESYIPAILEETVDFLDQLGDEGEFELIEFFQRLILNIHIRTMLGKEVRVKMDESFMKHYYQVFKGVEFSLTRNLPHLQLQRRRAKQKLFAIIDEVIQKRRKAQLLHNDFLQTFLDVQVQDSRPIPNALVRNLSFGMAWAGHSTGVGLTSWALVQLLQNPAYLDSVLHEQQVYLDKSKFLDGKLLKQLKRLEWAINETERMRPPLQYFCRLAAEGFDLGDYHIPKGWLTMLCPTVSHNLPEVFHNPMQYDPLRFAPDRAEHSKTPYSMIGFGLGYHNCMGKQFAYLEMKIMLTLLLQKYNMDLVDPNIQNRDGMFHSRPNPPCYIRYARK